MTALMAETGAVSTLLCSDAELVALVCLRRLPTEDEAWAKSGSVAAKLAIRSMPEFVNKNSLSACTADHLARLGVPFDQPLLHRLYKVFLGREPSASEVAHFSSVGTLASDDLVRRLMQSSESMAYDGLKATESDNSYIRALQVAANNMNFDLYSSYHLSGDKDHHSVSRKKLELSAKSLKILISLFSLSPEDLAFVRDSIAASWRSFFIDIDIWSGSARVGVEDLQPYDMFITNNNYLYGDQARVLNAVRVSSCFCVCWIWDNHHQFELSLDIVNAFDLVFPAHSNGHSYLHAGRAEVGNVVPCCAFQWSASEALELYKIYPGYDRSAEIYGRFNSYSGRIAYRDQFLTRAAAELAGNAIQVIPFNTNDWFAKTAPQKFAELSSYAVMLVSPIYNDVPARLFEVLLAGAIPVVPHGLPDIGLSFKPEEIRELPIITYIPENVESLRAAWKFAIAAFEDGGPEAAERRHAFIVRHHMLRNRLTSMLVESIELALREF